MTGPLDPSIGPKTYVQRSKRFFLDKAIYDHKVVEDLICVETAEWTIGADTFREHLERLRRLQQNGHEDIRIMEDTSGIVIVERRMDMERCRVITTYTPEGMEPQGGQDERFPHSYLSLIHILRRINERWKHFE